MEEIVPTWHRETVDANVERALHDLLQVPIVPRFYLAGGTALALHLGHRRSVDLDLFLGEDFDEDALIQKLQRLEGFSLAEKKPSTIHAQVHNIKVSFLAYAYPMLFPFLDFQGVQVADARDIACMKVSAIASRGTKRDFVDLYTLSQLHGLERILQWFKKKFAQTNYNIVHVLKSLTYFEEAERDPSPDLLVPLSWQDVKKFFARETPRLL